MFVYNEAENFKHWQPVVIHTTVGTFAPTELIKY